MNRGQIMTIRCFRKTFFSHRRCPIAATLAMVVLTIHWHGLCACSGVRDTFTLRKTTMASEDRFGTPLTLPASAPTCHRNGDHETARAKLASGLNEGEHCAEKALENSSTSGPDHESRQLDRVLAWNQDDHLDDNCRLLGSRLKEFGDLYRVPGEGTGLVLVETDPVVSMRRIETPGDLAVHTYNRLRVSVMKNGARKGSLIPAQELKVAIRCNAFLRYFQPVDCFTTPPLYLPGFQLTEPGYSDAGPGNRVLYIGGTPAVEQSQEAIPAFLDAMDFATAADRTNAAAALLTVMLRNHFPGGKPLVNITANKSHAGKDTIVAFIASMYEHVSISYGRRDWANQNAFVAAVKDRPDIALVNLGNIRAEGAAVGSAFIEHLLTTSDLWLHSYRTGPAVQRRNDIVIAATTNRGSFSEDLMNRSLPIHLELAGNIADRKSTIGNPREEYLPANRERIAAEARGMVARWVEAGMPSDDSVRHPFSTWAKCIGGILKVNDFEQFLANYNSRKTVQDPVRESIGLLGAEMLDEWKLVSKLAEKAVSLGLDRVLISSGDRGSDVARARGIGKTLSAHMDEDFHVETDSEILHLRLEKGCRRFESGGPVTTRYQFKLVSRNDLPTDDDQHAPSA